MGGVVDGELSSRGHRFLKFGDALEMDSFKKRTELCRDESVGR